MLSCDECIKLVSICCTFVGFGNERFFNTWEWKLDPYRMIDDNVGTSIIISRLFEEKVNLKEEKLCSEEEAGFFKHYVHLTKKNNTVWSYMRVKTEELYLQFSVTPSWDKITLLVDNTNTNGQLAFEYIGLIFPCVALKHNILTFHGALVEYNGYGVIISAASGVGKTTRARLWRDHKNALIINGDRATCQKVDGVWTGYGLPWSGTSGEQINRSVPLKALVVLERGEENTVRRMSPQESFGAVLPHLQCPTWDAELVGKAMEQMDDFLQNVPILHFKSRPDVDAIETLCKCLEEI